MTTDSDMAGLPPAPEGFSWKMLDEAILLKPDGWHDSPSDIDMLPIGEVWFRVYAFSPEHFSLNKFFETGVTFQALRGAKQACGMNAEEVTAYYTHSYLQGRSREEILIYDEHNDDRSNLLIYRFIDAPPGMTPIVIHKFLICDKEKDDLYALTFESPVALWDEMWAKYGETIFKNIRILQRT